MFCIFSTGLEWLMISWPQGANVDLPPWLNPHDLKKRESTTQNWRLQIICQYIIYCYYIYIILYIIIYICKSLSLSPSTSRIYIYICIYIYTYIILKRSNDFDDLGAPPS
jgi:hypothetical protein